MQQREAKADKEQEHTIDDDPGMSRAGTEVQTGVIPDASQDVDDAPDKPQRDRTNDDNT